MATRFLLPSPPLILAPLSGHLELSARIVCRWRAGNSSVSSLTLFDDYATQSSSSVWNPLERRWMLSPSTLPPRTNLSWYTNYDVLYENKGIGGGIEAHKKKKDWCIERWKSSFLFSIWLLSLPLRRSKIVFPSRKFKLGRENIH